MSAGETSEGLWLGDAWRLPPGGYAWHRFARRGYVALAGLTPLATVAPLADGGWSLRIEAFRWRGGPTDALRNPAVPPDCRWFPSSRSALAAAGRLLSGPPFYRREQLVSRGQPEAADPPTQAALGL